MKTKNVIVITFNGDKDEAKAQDQNAVGEVQSNCNSLTPKPNHLLEQLNQSIFSSLSSRSFCLTQQAKSNITQHIRVKDNMRDRLENYKEQQNRNLDQIKQKVEIVELKGCQRKRKSNKNKNSFQIKNVLQQISNSIQNCLKDGFIPSLTLEYWQNQDRPYMDKDILNHNYQDVIEKMQTYLENPSQHNIGCLLRMDGHVHFGLEKIFRSKILKKYIQCSKIRTLKQKSICLEAVDYLYRCFKQQQLCSLHTWAHKRQQKIQNRIQRILKRSNKSRSHD